MFISIQLGRTDHLNKLVTTILYSLCGPCELNAQGSKPRKDILHHFLTLKDVKIDNMIKYVALLRGINVGGNNKTEMSKLKKVFESLGFENVSTYINSGNVIFKTHKKDLEPLIEKTLKKTFGFEIRIVIRDEKNIKKLCKAIPKDWLNDAEQRTDVLFLWNEFDSKKSLDLIKTTEVDTLKYINGAIVWNVKRTDVSKSGMNKFIGTTIYKNMTARNINTVRKLNELLN